MEMQDTEFLDTLVNFLVRSAEAATHIKNEAYTIGLTELVEGEDEKPFATTIDDWVETGDVGVLDTYINLRDFPMEYQDNINETLSPDQPFPKIFSFTTTTNTITYVRAEVTNDQYTAGSLYRVTTGLDAIWVCAAGEDKADADTLSQYVPAMKCMMESFPYLYDKVDEQELENFADLLSTMEDADLL